MPRRSGLLIALALVVAGAVGSRAVRADEAAEAAVQVGVPPDVAIPSPLSLDEALRLLRTRGLDLLIADASVRTAEGGLQSSAALANPQVSLSAGPMLDYSASGAGCTGCSRAIVDWSVGDSGAIVGAIAGKRALGVEVARAALAAARLSRADALRKLELQVKRQYVQVVLETETLDLDREIQTSLQATLAVSRQQYPRVLDEGGLSRIEVQKLEGDQAVSSDVQTLRQAKAALAFLLGARRVMQDFEVDRDTLKFRVPAALEGATVASLLRRAVELRPDVAALGYQRERAGAALALAKRQQLPDVSLALQYSSWGTGQAAVTPPNFMGQVSADIPIFYQQQGEIRRARADVATQALQYAKALAQVTSDVETAFTLYEGNRGLVERMESRLLERAKTAFSVVERQYRAGSVGLNDYLDAYRTYIATRQEHLNDLSAYWSAVYQIEQAVDVELRQ